MSDRSHEIGGPFKEQPRYEAVLRHALDMVVVIGPHGEPRYVSPSTRKTLGYGPEDFVERDPLSTIHPDDRKRVVDALGAVSAGGSMIEPIRFKMVSAEGSDVVVEAVAVNLLDHPDVGGIVVNLRDVTAKVRVEEELELERRQLRHALSELGRERNFLRVLLDNIEAGVVACDFEGRLTVMNPAARRFHNVPDEVDPIGMMARATQLRHPDGTPMAVDENPLLVALGGEVIRDAELVLESKRGGRRVVMVNAQALYDSDGRKIGAVAAMHDVTDRKRHEDHLAQLALHDPLTKVANRLLLNDRMQLSLESLRRSSKTPRQSPKTERTSGVAVFLLDLDDFKSINDTYGHDVGDEVLVAVAKRLQGTVRPHDTVARLGGDEFVVLCEVEGGPEEMERIRGRIRDALARSYRVGGRRLDVGASVGAVFASDPDAEPSKLVSLADDDMYREKAASRRARHTGGHL